MQQELRNVRRINYNFGNIIFPLPQEEKNLARKLEKLFYKLNAAEATATFNRICLQEGLLPNYTRIRLHDPTAAQEDNTCAFRRRLATRQLQEKQQLIRSLKEEIHQVKAQWKDIQQEDRSDIHQVLKDLTAQDYTKKEKTILHKLNNLNGGKLRLPKKTERYVNLTQYTPTPAEEDLLQLGLNCHFADRPKPINKRVEVEVLIDNLSTLEREGKLQLKDPLKPLLLAEALTDRSPVYHHSLMNKDLRAAAKKLKQQEDITIRRADKTPALVLIDTNAYHQKLDNILADETKFRRIRKNPVDDIKREANKVIERINALSGAVKLSIIKGDYEPGYIYGNVKTHKNGNPLRPIISQIPTPTYHFAKRLNSLLAPYIPSKYRVQSSTDFLSIVRRTTPCGVIASLDVESLFTNVPVQQTIDMICDRVYRDDTTPNLGIPEDALRDLLRLCTMQAPFNTHRGQMFNQIDGVAMGSPLGVLFADFYMGTIEERVFAQHPVPITYCRYVDDTYVQANNREEIEALRRKFEECSVLKFTMEDSVDGTLPFLDVSLKMPDNTSNSGNTSNTTDDDHNTSSDQRITQSAQRMRQGPTGSGMNNTTPNTINTTPNTTNTSSDQGIIQSAPRTGSGIDNTTPNTTNTTSNTTNTRVLRSHTRRQRELQNSTSNTSLNPGNLNETVGSAAPTPNTPVTTNGPNTNSFITTVYRKPTNMGLCLNGLSECPDRYRKTAISAYIRRALTHCSSWKSTTDEIDNATQMLLNNGYSNKEVSRITKQTIDAWYTNNNEAANNEDHVIKLFHKNQFHNNYKKDEKALRNIINENVTVSDENAKLKLVIYYKNKKTTNLIMKNNPLDT